MTREQLNALINLGFTGDQILAINDAGKKPTPSANPNPNPDPTPSPNPAPAANPAPPAADGNESETVKMLKEMLGLMQKGAINGMSVNNVPEKDAADILADIIDPE